MQVCVVMLARIEALRLPNLVIRNLIPNLRPAFGQIVLWLRHVGSTSMETTHSQG
jgi:hypothetical protein